MVIVKLGHIRICPCTAKTKRYHGHYLKHRPFPRLLQHLFCIQISPFPESTEEENYIKIKPPFPWPAIQIINCPLKSSYGAHQSTHSSCWSHKCGTQMGLDLACPLKVLVPFNRSPRMVLEFCSSCGQAHREIPLRRHNS